MLQVALILVQGKKTEPYLLNSKIIRKKTLALAWITRKMTIYVVCCKSLWYSYRENKQNLIFWTAGSLEKTLTWITRRARWSKPLNHLSKPIFKISIGTKISRGRTKHLCHKFLRVVHPRKENNYIDWVGMLIDGSTAGRMICSESGDALDLNPGVQWQCCHLIGWAGRCRCWEVCGKNANIFRKDKRLRIYDIWNSDTTIW